MAAKRVLDASALLALLHLEPGFEAVKQHLPGAAVSSVNLCEVASKLLEKGLDARDVQADLEALGLTVIPFDDGLAYRAAALQVSTRKQGLSLGDRACLATADQLQAVALSADRAWSRLKLEIEVEIVR